MTHERPQRPAQSEDVPARAFGLGHLAGLPGFEQALHFLTDRPHIADKAGRGQRAVRTRATSGTSGGPALATPPRSPASAPRVRSWPRYLAADVPNTAAAATWDTSCRRSSDRSPTSPRSARPRAPGHLAAARQPDRKDRHPGRDDGPQPGPLPPFPPPRFVGIGGGLGPHIGPRLDHGSASAWRSC